MHPSALSITARPAIPPAVAACLKREIAMQAALLSNSSEVEQLHFGGAPTYFSDAQMDELMAHLRRNFRFAPDAPRHSQTV